MKRVSHADFVRKFSAFCDEALAEPIVLTRNGRDRLLVLSVEKYRQLLSTIIMNGTGEPAVKASIDDLEALQARSGTAGE
ncbi:MAG: type II toxin-antitoxin system Phd/YefM family antitoxin [Parafilimonas terrae]|nr:type II toxin-antitoxin system Phd/YefM family antitoxin [Parafilimonas terrae]